MQQNKHKIKVYKMYIAGEFLATKKFNFQQEKLHKIKKICVQ